jgi:hypothetical protein
MSCISVLFPLCSAIVLAASFPAIGEPATSDCPPNGPKLFQTTIDAEAYCKGDFVVWANTHSPQKIYHFPEGKTLHGGFTCIHEAKACKYRATTR